MTERENLKRVFTPGQKPEWVPYVFSAYNFIVPTDVVADRPPFGVMEGKDWFGVKWVWDVPTTGFMQAHDQPFLCDNITKWKEQIKFPDLEAIDWERLTAPTAAQYDANRMTQTMLQCGIFERLHSLIGFEAAFLAMYTEPEALYDFMSAIADHWIAVVGKVAKHYKPDVITIMDDYGTHHGAMMSSALFREHIMPHGKRLAEAIRSKGILYMHHSCGTYDTLLDDMVEMGVQALTAIAPTNNVDAIIAKYGDRLIYDGGMNNIGVLDRSGSTDEQIKTEVRRAIDKFAPTGSYVAGGYCNRPVEEKVAAEVRTYGHRGTVPPC